MKRTPRKTKQVSVKQILAMSSEDISKLSDKDLRAIVRIANSAANKRIKRAQKAGVSSAVLERAQERGGFYVKNITDRTSLENAFTAARNFLSSKTSTTRGIRSSQRKMYKNLAAAINPELPKKEKIDVSKLDDVSEKDLKEITGLIWAQVDKLAEDKSLGITKTERYTIAAHAYNVTTRNRAPVHTKSGLLNSMRSYYKKMYQDRIQTAQQPLTNMTPEEEKLAKIYTDIT